MDDSEYVTEEEYLDKTLRFIDERLDRLSRPPTWNAPYRDTAKALLASDQKSREDLEHARPSPYFGRVDFERSDGKTIEAYIGVRGIHDPGTMSYVYDWRAKFPADVYYADPNIPVSYEAPGGDIHGTITRKRQYEIEASRLLRVTEVYRRGTTVAGSGDVGNGQDAFLQRQLAAGRTGQLQQAVATLRPEQFQQVAASRSQVMLVQGVAGSGKSVVGLHRLAYLLSPLNTGSDRVSEERTMFFGPSRNFLRYVSNLLPSLDVKAVQQTTVLAWMLDLLSERVYLDRREPLLEKLLRDRNDRWEFAGQAARLKGSLALVRAIERHAQDLRSAYARDRTPIVV